MINNKNETLLIESGSSRYERAHRRCCLKIGFAASHWPLLISKRICIFNTEENLIRQKIKDIVLKENSDAKVILYGSGARETELQESDWDILVLLNKPSVSFKDEQKIRHKLFSIEIETGESISTFVY